MMILAVVVLVLVAVGTGGAARAEGPTTRTWCVARSSAGAAALQAALDYACGSGAADCVPLEPSGLCYLPNTLAAHASYAINSYYQRSDAAPGACDFGGAATVSITDPSYGSCTYPSSASTAGGKMPTPSNNNTQTTTPATSTPLTPTPPFGAATGGAAGLSPPGFDTSAPDANMSDSSSHLPLLQFTILCFLLLLF